MVVIGEAFMMRNGTQMKVCSIQLVAQTQMVHLKLI